jgi:hypothetical protein
VKLMQGGSLEDELWPDEMEGRTSPRRLSCGLPAFWRADDKNLHLPGRAELPLCPELLGGAAAPPYPRREDFCPAPAFGNNRIKSLILGPGGSMVQGQGGQKPFQFMFTWHTQRQPFQEVVISPESGAVIVLCRERKAFASNNFRKSPHRFVRILMAIVIHEQPAVY